MLEDDDDVAIVQGARTPARKLPVRALKAAVASAVDAPEAAASDCRIRFIERVELALHFYVIPGERREGPHQKGDEITVPAGVAAAYVANGFAEIV